MSEITLKNESVIEIGRAVGTQVATISGGGKALSTGGAVASPMNPFESMMVVLQDIRDGIHVIADKFSDSVSIQKDQINKKEDAADLAQAGGGEGIDPAITDGAGEKGPGFMEKAKAKIGGLMGAGGIKGMLIKGGLIAGLLGLAVVLKKYGKQIAEKIAPIVDGVKAFFSAFTDDIGPIFDSAVETVKSALTGIVDIVKGLFTGDASTFFGGVKKLFIDFPIQLVSYIGDAFFSLLENALAAFGIESTMVTDIKNFFRELPEKISELFQNIKDFFVITIPEKVQAIKDALTTWFTNIKDKAISIFTQIKDFFVITIPEKVQSIKDSITEWFTGIVEDVKGIFTKVKEFFTVTIPTKVQEIKDSIVTWFTNIKDEVVGLFTKVKDFVMVTIPEKLKEMTDSITEKVTSIKDKIVEFAMAPFKKIKELMKGLLIGVLESVEGLPFIGDKAKAMKEKIIASDRLEAGATLEEATAGLSTLQSAEQNAAQLGKVTTMPDGAVINPEDGEMLKISSEKEAQTMAAELSKSGQGKFEAVFDDGGFFGRKFYKIMKTGEAIAGANGSGTTGGATGGELNTESQMLLASGTGGGGGGVVVGGTTQVNNTSSVNHNAADENAGVADKTVSGELYG